MEIDNINIVVYIINDDIGKRIPTIYINNDDISNIILYRNTKSIFI